MNTNWVPNRKVMAAGVGYTLSEAIISVCDNRLHWNLTDPESDLIVLVCTLAVAYFIPEKGQAEGAWSGS